MQYLISFVMLSSFAWRDWKTKEIKIIPLMLFGIIGVFLHLIKGTPDIFSMLLGLLLGIFFYVIAWLTQGKIGKGDGVLIGVMGIYLGIYQTMFLVLIACVLVLIYGGVLWKKVGVTQWKKEVAFVPFLCIAQVIQGGVMICQNYVC